MPNTKTAKKELRKNEVRYIRNRSVLTKVRNLYGKAKAALLQSDSQAAKESIVAFESFGMKSSKTHGDKKSVSSKVSRLVLAFKKHFPQN